MEIEKVYSSLEQNRTKKKSNDGLFNIIYRLGKRVEAERASTDNELSIYFTPAFRDMIGHHRYSRQWAQAVKDRICALGLGKKPLHIISANMHSVVNLLYGHAAVRRMAKAGGGKTIYDLIPTMREKAEKVLQFARKNGLYELVDASGTHIDCQIIDTSQLENLSFHRDLEFDIRHLAEKPVILVMDYAFGTQAFEAMDELLNPSLEEASTRIENVQSISVLGKAGILPGKKGDLMLPTARVLEGTPHNYLVDNDLSQKDFDKGTRVFVGPIVTVLGTSLQNRDVLQKFQESSWRAVGLEMEGGHYQRAINAAMIRGHISRDVKLRYAYYASDNPLHLDETLAAGSMGEEGIRPTYMITKVILEKILGGGVKKASSTRG